MCNSAYVNRPKTIVDVLMAGVFCGCVATLISTALVAMLADVPAHAFHWSQLLIGAVWVLAIAFVPAGLFGFLCGVAGRLYLMIRLPHITTTRRLIAECVVVGVLLSLCFPLFLRLMNWGDAQDWTIVKGTLFCVSVGFLVSILYATVYRRNFLG